MSKNNDLQRMHAIRGYRLTEAIERSGIKPAELLRKAKQQSTRYFSMSPQTLSQIMHGKRPLKYEDAVLFSEILGEEADYLMGGPSTITKQLFQYEKDADKYRMILSRIGASVSSYILDDTDKDISEIKGYGVTYNIRPYNPEEGSNFDFMEVPVSDMESFYQDVCRFIEKRFEVLKDLCSEEV